MTYHQLQVTLILVSLAQSVHDLTPPDVLTPVVRKLAQEFVHPGVGAEVIAAGINAIREICRRQPWCMEEDLLSDLIDYRKSKDKGVVTASRGLLQLFREVNPGLLKKRERGKTATMGTGVTQVPEYGHTRQKAEAIDGLDLLEDHFAAMRKEANGGVSDDEQMGADQDDEAGWDNWDVDSDADSESSGWHDVSDDEGDLQLSDSEDEGPRKDRQKRKLDAEEHEEAPEKKKGKRAIRKEEEAEKRGEGKKPEADAGVDMDDNDDSKSVVSVAPSMATEASVVTKKLSLLAQQKILTPADFVLLNELRLKAAQDLVKSGGGSGAKRKLAALEASKRHVGEDEADRFLTENEILGPRKKTKADYEERMESIKKGREGREKFGSSKGKKTKEVKSSSTNREKLRSKPLMMAVQYVPSLSPLSHHPLSPLSLPSISLLNLSPSLLRSLSIFDLHHNLLRYLC